ncbi:MAG: hypothetical protein WC328_17705, partial [Kiritimatiellia bacterium]
MYNLKSAISPSTVKISHPRSYYPIRADASNFLSLRPFTHDFGALITLPVSGVWESTRQGMQWRIKITAICVICGQKLEVAGKLSGTCEKDAQDWGRGRPR